MGVAFLLIAGGIVGWLAAVAMRQDDLAGSMRNIAVGTIGAVAAGLILSPMLGGGNLLAGGYHVSALLIALFGAVAMLAVVNMLRREWATR